MIQSAAQQENMAAMHNQFENMMNQKAMEQ